MALGWLHASHRELDLKHSTPEQPGHLHRRELMLAEGVPVEIDIWPSSTQFLARGKLRVVVQGTDIHKYPGDQSAVRHVSARNKGPHVIYAGGQYDSYLLIPLIPAASPGKA